MSRRALPLAVLALIAGACSVGAPSPSPQPSPSPAPSPTPSPSPATGFYLRAWYTQSIPPRGTFAWLPSLTVADGVLYDGNVAVDAIFPGPLTIVPIARAITPDGIQKLITEARNLGLLSDKTDYSGGQPMPGARVGQLQLTVDGVTYNLTGNPDLPPAPACPPGACHVDPGTQEAFATYWQELTMAETWLGADLGPTLQYVPDRVALLLVAPTDQSLPNRPVDWPFETTLANAGVAFPGETGDRCMTLYGDALGTIWPTLRDGTQLTFFKDSAGTQAAPVVRVLVPGDESPCPDAN